MKKLMWMAAVAALLGAGAANAEGLPSQSKMANLGLSSMSVVSDQQGNEVRGQGFGASTLTFNILATAGGAGGQHRCRHRYSKFGVRPKARASGHRRLRWFGLRWLHR